MVERSLGKGKVVGSIPTLGLLEMVGLKGLNYYH